jgi:tetraacyldisaccharide 4'-kinase
MLILRYFLFPFAFIYGCITYLRNKLFDWGLKKEHKIPFPSICIGNLSVGGTGKTPHVLLLNEWLADDFHVNIVSRGYGRKTNGLIEANQNSTSDTIGDEPMLFHLAVPQPTVIVAEKRTEAIHWIKAKAAKDTFVLLDDAFQHRHVKAGMNILLTDFQSPFFTDFMLPMGNLREFRSGSKRADIVIVTKCPGELSKEEKAFFYSGIKRNKDEIFFSKIRYGDMLKWCELDLPLNLENIVLVSGIANPKPLEEHLSKRFNVKSVIFRDHHRFTKKDIQDIHEIFGNFASEKTIILTTAKDAMRLHSFKGDGDLKKFPWFVQEMTVEMDREKELKEKIKAYVRAV